MGDFLASVSEKQSTNIVEITMLGSKQPFICTENASWKIYQIGYQSKEDKRILDLFESDPFSAPQKLARDCAYFALRKSDSTLFIARDPFGFIPIRYLRNNKGWLIFTGPKIPDYYPLRIDHERLNRFITHDPDRGDNDFFVGIKRLLPGHLGVFKHGSKTIRRYYKPNTEYSSENIDLLSEKFRKALFTSIPSSEIMALSGGLDSSSMLPGVSKLQTFTMFSKRFPSCNESKEVKELSSHFNLKNTLHNIDQNQLWTKSDDFQNPHYFGYGPIFHAPVFGEQAFFSRMTKGTKGPIITGIGGDNALDVSINTVARHLIQSGNMKGITQLWKKYPKSIIRQSITTPFHSIFDRSGIKRRAKKTAHFPWSVYPAPSTPSYSNHWGEARRDRILSWQWEQVTRLLDSHGRAIGRPIVSPWMSSAVWKVLLRVSPDMLFHHNRHKGFLRYAMKGLLPDSIRCAGKSKHFGKPVEIQILSRQEEIMDRFQKSNLSSKMMINDALFRKHFADLCEGIKHNLKTGVPAPTALSWPTIAADLWLDGIPS